jgi:hypothetical protein
MHKNRTAKGLALQEKHNLSYKKRLIGKQHIDGRKVINCEYIGNSVYGIIKVYFEDNSNILIGSQSFRPTNKDILNNGIIL